MISEFQQLTKKVGQIAALVQTLRSENTVLRNQLIELTTVNDELTERIQEAQERVSAVIDSIPNLTVEEQEPA